ncbi:LysR family transcriptional regulator [Labrys sp. La1]|uniref:LysR family transcriptional regulator n=1 Tax=Labrys sp. La1 TaxID=3404917 RepID=UPI003EBB7253
MYLRDLWGIYLKNVNESLDLERDPFDAALVLSLIRSISVSSGFMLEYPKLARTTALRYFWEVAAQGSFRGAAESLHIAASAINRQVSNLEADLGAKLFERARGRAGLQLTDAGRILQYRLRAAINELRIAGDEIIALKGLERGHVTIGFNDVVVNTVMPEVIESFHRSHPNITFSIKVDTTRGLLSRLKGGEIDFAVGYNFPNIEDLSFIKSIPLRMYLVASADHPLARRSSVTLADMGGHKLILPDGSGLLRHIFESAFRGTDLQMDPIVETNSLELIHALAESGIGVSIVTGRAQRATGRGRLVHVEIDDDRLLPNVLACCKLSMRSLSPAAVAFADAVCDALTTFGDRELHLGKGEGGAQSASSNMSAADREPVA